MSVKVLVMGVEFLELHAGDEVGSRLEAERLGLGVGPWGDVGGGVGDSGGFGCLVVEQ